MTDTSTKHSLLRCRHCGDVLLSAFPPFSYLGYCGKKKCVAAREKDPKAKYNSLSYIWGLGVKNDD